MSKDKLPLYLCHKHVRAAKIKSVAGTSQGVLLIFENCKSIAVNSAWLNKHMPDAGKLEGGYFVQYEDGYTSWSPGDTFEKGYKRVQESSDA